MKLHSIARLGFLAIFSVTSSTTLHADVSGSHDFMVASLTHAISAPGLVSAGAAPEFPDDGNQDDLLNEKQNHELTDEQIRRLYLKLILIRGVGH